MMISVAEKVIDEMWKQKLNRKPRHWLVRVIIAQNGPKCENTLFSLVLYTLCPKKVYPLMFDSNFGKYGLKILSPGDLYKNSLCTHTKISTSPAICCYTTL